MDKVNEAIEVGEQETPFHLLAHEEQQRIIVSIHQDGVDGISSAGMG
ncbi:hypothetical protein [Aeromonas caviae]